jgi:hypothetical protein
MGRRVGMAKSLLLIAGLVLVFLITVPHYCYSTGNDIAILSVRTGKITNSVWFPNSYFFHNENVSVEVTAENNGTMQEQATIFVSAFDNGDEPIDLSETNVTFSAGETKIVYFTVGIPRWALTGSAYINAGIEPNAGTVAYSTTAYFTILPGVASNLTLQTLSRNQQMSDMIIWFEGTPFPSPVTVPLAPGNYSVTAEPRTGSLEDTAYGSILYVSDFKSWNDGSTSNSRTVNVTDNLNMTLTANYISYRLKWQPQ